MSSSAVNIEPQPFPKPGSRGDRSKARDVVVTAIASQALGFVNGLLLARGLAADSRGVLAEAVLWPVTIGSIVTAGVLQAVTFGSASIASVTSVRMPLKLVGWMLLPVSILLAAVLPSLVNSAALVPSLVYLAWIPISGVTGVLAARLLGLDRVTAYNALRLSSVGFNLLAVTALLAGGVLTPLSVVASYVISELATALLAWRLSPKSQSADSGMSTSSLLRYAGRASTGAAAQALGERGDQLVLSQQLPPSALGNYVAANTLASTAGLFGTSVADLVLARVARRRPTLRGVVVATTAALSLGAGSALALAAVAPYVIPAALGESYRPAIPITQLLVIYFAVVGAVRVVAGVLKGLGLPGRTGIVEVTSVFVRLLFLLLLVPSRGLIGAPVALILASAFQLVAYAALVRRALARR